MPLIRLPASLCIYKTHIAIPHISICLRTRWPLLPPFALLRFCCFPHCAMRFQQNAIVCRVRKPSRHPMVCASHSRVSPPEIADTHPTCTFQLSCAFWRLLRFDDIWQCTAHMVQTNTQSLSHQHRRNPKCMAPVRPNGTSKAEIAPDRFTVRLSPA